MDRADGGQAHSRGRSVGYGLLAAAVVAITFAPVVRHEFAGFDDATFLYWNSNLGRPLAKNILWYWRHPFGHLYVPLAFGAWNLLAALGHRHAGDGAGVAASLDPAAFHAASLPQLAGSVTSINS